MIPKIYDFKQKKWNNTLFPKKNQHTCCNMIGETIETDVHSAKPVIKYSSQLKVVYADHRMTRLF